jgi:predicted amidohydrolase YtcJ
MTASLVLANGRVYTMNPNQPSATAVALRGQHVLAVGNDLEMEALLAVNGQKIDLGGICVTPGLVDAHVHFQHFALSLKNVDLDGAASLEDALQRVAAFVAGVSGDTGWLRGRGWSQDTWPDRAFPTAADLDAVVSDRPVYLAHKSGHAAWVNSMALRQCRIHATTNDPPGGQIQRDVAGLPTGILFEDAMGLVGDHIPRPTPDELVTAMRQAQHHCWEVGLTGIHDFDGRDCFTALQMMHERRELGLRVLKNIPVYRLNHALEIGLRSGFGDDWLRIGGIKIFADGALGSRTAAMIAPYEGEPENTGIVVTDKEEMLEKARDAAKGGLSLTVHAIGDRANHDVLDVYDLLRKEEQLHGLTGLRHRIEHAQVLQPDDLARFAQLGIIASMQPVHATSDMEMADRYWGDRARYSYAWRSILESGAKLVFGSDAPVEKIDPLPGIHAAVTRRRANGHPGPAGWYPEQRLSMTETIHAFTTAAAITSGCERRFGSISPGKLADLTFFDRDIFMISPEELLATRIAGTMVGGVFRYRTW